ncbi:hypothetical protein [Streptomyces zhihengii]|uniref:Uncharacterized protein n=1 Tax=Streptomyces zhihengii TaxID=1818004 RepID=A0ABS2UVV5_9ACTN|nr:hypothetical protein [Streptomyces zhihengii]MBM9620997.1 hypothetical protein [Streptomyces zhihengii]
MTGAPDPDPPQCEHPVEPHAGGLPRLFPGGRFCDLHTPRARRGLPEIPPGPGWPPGNYLNQRDLDQEENHDDPDPAPDPDAA